MNCMLYDVVGHKLLVAYRRTRVAYTPSWTSAALYKLVKVALDCSKGRYGTTSMGSEEVTCEQAATVT